MRVFISNLLSALTAHQNFEIFISIIIFYTFFLSKFDDFSQFLTLVFLFSFFNLICNLTFLHFFLLIDNFFFTTLVYAKYACKSNKYYFTTKPYRLTGQKILLYFSKWMYCVREATLFVPLNVQRNTENVSVLPFFL